MSELAQRAHASVRQVRLNRTLAILKANLGIDVSETEITFDEQEDWAYYQDDTTYLVIQNLDWSPAIYVRRSCPECQTLQPGTHPDEVANLYRLGLILKRRAACRACKTQRWRRQVARRIGLPIPATPPEHHDG